MSDRGPVSGMDASGVSVALDARAELGEGPIWDADRQRLLFVDITGQAIHEFDPTRGVARVIPTAEPVGALALTARGDWVAAAGRGFYRVDPQRGDMVPIVLVERPDADTRMNDGAVDARGRFWAGSMSTRRQDGQGTLWRLDTDGTAHRMLAPVTTSNGPDWSPDNRLMYYVDTRTRRVDLFDFDLDAGTMANRRVFVDLAGETGRPDGLIVDADGAVWVALWAGGAVRRYLPDGRLDRVVPLPVTQTTKCAFGGPSLEDAYVTSAWRQLTDEQRIEQPLAGALFQFTPGIKGRLPNRFAG
ncbi:MAG: SMP-30/gluconolactonase/LRE family protein [Vicinamibacterales bacterium]